MHELLFYIITGSWVTVRYFFLKRIRGSAEAEVSPVPASAFAEYDAVVALHIPYYTRLSAQGRQRFVSRMDEILEAIPLAGKDGFEVSREVHILTAACITQLTFGFARPHIPFLKGVSIYPDVFYSRLLEAWVKGMAVGTGIVFISWKHFLEGYKDASDTYNLGLHEFAHMLRFQAMELSLYDERLSSYFAQWEKVGAPVFMQTRSREEDFFREYGGTNSSEFFSVCIEHFFEVPEAFEHELPELYYHLCYLMKQNPLNTYSDYAFDTSDIEAANELVSVPVPVYRLRHSQREQFFWQGVREFILLPVFLFVAIYMDFSTASQLIVLRLLIVSLLIMAAVRLLFYRDLKAVTDKQYLRHLGLQLIPLMALGAVLFEMFVIE